MLTGAIDNWSVSEIAVGLIIILAIVGIVIVAVRYFQIPIPAWFVQICGIVLVAFVCIVAIRLLMRM